MSHRLTAVLMTLGVIALLVVNGAGFFFHQPYYESWDLAANSLSVERAKHFAEGYGPYSRWGFHHPGPAFFYVLAWGEWLFYDRLHLTPAPYNAQVLTQVGISAAFYGAALAVFARRLTRRAEIWFWPLALALGAAVFGSASGLPSYDFLRGPSAFTSTWSAHEIVMPFLCLLAAGASVAGGEGRDLPLLAVSAGALLHLHVAQPLFVGPLTLLAYVGLVTACARREPVADPSWWRRVGAAWRAFRGRHLAAGVILAVFALPMVVDLFRGADSNFAAILHHLRTHHGDHKSLLKSLFYFLQFGAATPYEPGRVDFGHFDGAGMFYFLHVHTLVYTGWALAAAVVIVAARRGRFLAWASGFLLAAIVLTLVWGTVQDGEMFYYNSWLNFAIYYFGLLIVVTEFATRQDAQIRRRWLELVGVALVTAWAGLAFSGGLRVSDPAPETTALLHASIQRVLAATDRGGAALEFPDVEWPVAAAVGLEMIRAGRPFAVNERWLNVFGRAYTSGRPFRAEGYGAVPWRFAVGPATVPWRADAPEALAPATRELREQLAATSAAARGFPMLDDARVFTAPTPLSLHDGQSAEIDFRRGGNAPAFMSTGWSEAEPWGTWSDGTQSVLRFATDERVGDGGVEMTVELHPFVYPAGGLTAQRVSVHVNGRALAPERRVVEGAPPLVWTVPAAAWNANAGAGSGMVVAFGLPDAASPAALDRTGRTGDTRQLGVGVSRVRFRAVPPGGSP